MSATQVKRLAVPSIACGAAAWLSLPLMGVVPLSPALALVSIILGVAAIRSVKGVPRSRVRTAGWVGFVLGLSALLVPALIFAWVIVCFLINPVAH